MPSTSQCECRAIDGLITLHPEDNLTADTEQQIFRMNEALAAVCSNTPDPVLQDGSE